MSTRFAAALLAPVCLCAAAPAFEPHVIATGLDAGYQVVPFDVNRDGKMDLIALASRLNDLLWFEGPSWKRHVLASGLSRMINVAACGDAMVVAHAFENEPKRSIGIVSVLEPGEDRSKPWKVREIDRLTTSHRIRCASPEGPGQTIFVNAPLAGAKAEAPNYKDRVPLVFYRPGEWTRVTIDASNEGVMHGIFVHPWAGGQRDHILTASFSGIHDYWIDKKGQWQRVEIATGDPAPAPKSGASDIAVGYLAKRKFLASIEPWHGNQLVVYTEKRGVWKRNVIDDSLVDGHTVVTADLDGDGRQEVIAGFRGQGRSVYLYHSNDPRGERWFRTPLDQGGMAAAACAAADLNGDGRVDIACIGSATANLKWYENKGK